MLTRTHRPQNVPTFPLLTKALLGCLNASTSLHKCFEETESWYISFEEYPLLRTTSMKYISLLAQVLYKTKSITVFYFPRLHLQQKCDLGAQAADHNLLNSSFYCAFHTTLRVHADMRRSRLCPQVTVLLSHNHPRGKGNKQFPGLCS